MKKILQIILLIGLVLPILAGGQVNPESLNKLIEANKSKKSGRLIVSQNESTVSNTTFYGKTDELYRVYSITKLFSGLAVGILYEKGLIQSPEDKLSLYFDEWKNDPVKSQITIRHVLQHTSGLLANKGSLDIYDQKDIVAFALKSDVITTPGHSFFYNNRAINLISGLVKKRSGLSLEAFLAENLFKPLGIKKHLWTADESGNTWAMDGLRLSADDLSKVGILLANEGKWEGKTIIPQKWLDVAFQLPLMNAVNATGGYGFSLQIFYFNEEFTVEKTNIELMSKNGLSKTLIEKLNQISQKSYPSWSEFGKVLGEKFTKDEIETIAALCGKNMIPTYTTKKKNFIVMHSGEIGQQLVVIPSYKIAVVRFIDEKNGRQTDSNGNYKYAFTEMLPLVVNLGKTN